MNALGSKDLDLNGFSSSCLSCCCCLQWPCLVTQQLQHDWSEMTLWKGDRRMAALHYCPYGFTKLHNVFHCSPRGSVNLLCTTIVPVKTKSDIQTLLICIFFSPSELPDLLCHILPPLFIPENWTIHSAF